MQVSWENPFGKEFKVAGLEIAVKGGITTEQFQTIREEQLAFSIHLGKLQEEAIAVFGKASTSVLFAAERVVSYAVMYRNPDHPNILGDFSHQVTDHAVILPAKPATAPLIDKIFPLRPVDDDADLKKLVVLGSIQNTLMPDEVRIVYPKTTGLMRVWSGKLDASVVNFSYGETRIAQPFKIESHLRH
jgi:uncharacterized protein Usg